MKVVPQVHCGEVVSRSSTEQAILTETIHHANSRLRHHAHDSAHLAILVEGTYFERMNGNVFLRLPGDEVFYPALTPHENIFGKSSARCLNIEQSNWTPDVKPARPAICDEIDALFHDHGLQSLTPLAVALGFHPVYLARTFRAKVGTSVGSYLKTLRVRRTAELIFQSDLSLGAVAVETGYYDQSHLTNEFSQVAGFTPGELRRFADG